MSLGDRHPRRVDLLMTHLHTDHIEGLRFFTPLWVLEVRVRIWGPPAPLKQSSNGSRRTSRRSSRCTFATSPAGRDFIETPADSVDIGSALVSAQLIQHPGAAVGYRIEENGRSLAYLPDHEPALGQGLTAIERRWISEFALARDADLLVHDGSTPRLSTGPVWGGGIPHGRRATFAERAGARRLVLFHHDPLHTDEQLEAMLTEARELPAASSNPIELGSEGGLRTAADRRIRMTPGGSEVRLRREDVVDAHSDGTALPPPGPGRRLIRSTGIRSTA